MARARRRPGAVPHAKARAARSCGVIRAPPGLSGERSFREGGGMRDRDYPKIAEKPDPDEFAAGV
jgi:hypothetical protein